MNAGQILRELVRRFDWYQNRLLPEFEIDGGQADLVVISKARYLTEIEIKVSLADWNADQSKAKWRVPRPHVSRFYYAVPQALVERAPAWVPASAGLIGVHQDDLGSCWSREIRAAKRVRAQPVDEQIIRRFYDASYFRYWRQRLKIEREQRERTPLKSGWAA